MSDPVRAPSVPAKAQSAEAPKYRLPDGALTPEELAVFDERDQVDVDAALAWLNGTGPDPWPNAGQR